MEPSRGNRPVSGFSGHGLVNTYVGGDGPQGTATSKPFRIQRRYIGFLIGGGNNPGKTCINLRVDGKVVRTATGKNQEALEPASWDVADLKGRDAVLEIVDRSSDGWGHINIDRIIFSDVAPEPLLSRGTTIESVVKALPSGFYQGGRSDAAGGLIVHSRQHYHEGAHAGRHGAATRGRPDGPLPAIRACAVSAPGEHGYRVLATHAGRRSAGDSRPAGQREHHSRPWPRGCLGAWAATLLAALRGEPLKPGERLVPGNPTWGTMALTAFDAQAVALPAWTSAGRDRGLRRGAQRSGSGQRPRRSASRAKRSMRRSASPSRLRPANRTAPPSPSPGTSPTCSGSSTAGNLYSRRWPDAAAVAGYLAKNLDALWQRTQLYHATLYQSNLPEEFLDAMASQSVILRGPTCFWSEDGYFGGFEGSYGCCPLNCTHVWNYAQSHARLFPDVGRNMRISNFITYLHANGETSHREHAVHEAFIDGHCACIEAAYREYQLSPDRRFLEKIWPGVKKSVDWLIHAIDPQDEGVPARASGQHL